MKATTQATTKARSTAKPKAKPMAKAPGSPSKRTPAKGRPATAMAVPTEETVRNIVEVATVEFAAKGFSGARVDEIAAQTHTSKRMIYYHFGGKEELYLAVLEATFRKVRIAEAALRLGDLPPEEGARKLVRFRFDYHHKNPMFVRLVMNENIHEAGFLSRSNTHALLNVNSPAIEAIRTVYEPGCRQGVFRPGLDLIDIHLLISSLSFFRVSNRHTFSLNFNRDIGSPADTARMRENVVEMVLRYLKPAAG